MFGLRKSSNGSRAGVFYNVSDGYGFMAYNGTGVKLNQGDVVSLVFTGTSGSELKAIIPVTNSIAMYQGVCDEPYGIENGGIGRIRVYGKIKVRSVGHSSWTSAGKFLRVLNRIAFDGTSTHLAFVAGNSTTRDTITDSDSGFVTDGFLPGMRIAITGATTSSNNGSFEIYSVAAGTITLTTYGQLTSEAGASGTAIVAHGYLRYTGASDTSDTFAVAMERNTTTTSVSEKLVYLTGMPKAVAAS